MTDKAISVGEASIFHVDPLNMSQERNTHFVENINFVITRIEIYTSFTLIHHHEMTKKNTYTKTIDLLVFYHVVGIIV